MEPDVGLDISLVDDIPPTPVTRYNRFGSDSANFSECKYVYAYAHV